MEKEADKNSYVISALRLVVCVKHWSHSFQLTSPSSSALMLPRSCRSGVSTIVACGWGAIGQIYADYCMLKTMDDDTEENEEERMRELVDSIHTRINAPVFEKPIQRLCVKTIARELFEIQRSIGNTDFSLPLSTSQMTRLIS
ncbi:hypothetical protein KIN20_001892 [Parelaphostrongylus tenuis]|uniref:Uncharacterized protein n=1 Tax=Parelaphostrongylus tenuis TaxID=148309 RepID=A0AAD5MDG8_PARTN|nr:hypothetical protein KIN20_001892 [Parelaphostrongylus tenuis]